MTIPLTDRRETTHLFNATTLLGTVLRTVPAQVIYLVHFSAQAPVFIDDAYIFYRYAANWAAGYGLVYNAGEHVEGYSSYLWTMLLALGARLFVNLELLGPGLGIVLGCTCLVLVSHLASTLFPRSPSLSVAATVACSLSTGLAFYAAAGMDTVLFAAVLLTAVAAAYRSTSSGQVLGAALSSALLVLGRAEGVVYATALLAVLGAYVFAGCASELSKRGFAAIVSAVAATAAAQFALRFAVYRELLPATVSAKNYVGHVLGHVSPANPQTLSELLATLRLGRDYEMFALQTVCLPLGILAVQLVRRPRALLLPSLLAAAIFVNTIIGMSAAGDWMPYHRLIVPVWPLIVLFVAWGVACILSSLMSTEAANGSLAKAVLIGALAVMSLYSMEKRQVDLQPLSLLTGVPEQGRSLFKKQVGLALRRLGQPAVVVTNVAGKMPYFAGPRTYVLDLLGLTNRHNSTFGSTWSPTYGRIDYPYSFGRRFDALVTNNIWDLRALAAFWESQGNDGREYAVYLQPQWIENSFLVIARKSHPLAAELERLCECQATPLDTAFLRTFAETKIAAGLSP